MLPEHVAVKMRQDLGSDDSEQFKKIYMSRHENVRYVFFFNIVLLYLCVVCVPGGGKGKKN